MLYKNNIGPQVRRKRYALGWSQSTFAAKLQIAGLDISRAASRKSRRDFATWTTNPSCSLPRC